METPNAEKNEDFSETFKTAGFQATMPDCAPQADKPCTPTTSMGRDGMKVPSPHYNPTESYRPTSMNEPTSSQFKMSTMFPDRGDIFDGKKLLSGGSAFKSQAAQNILGMSSGCMGEIGATRCLTGESEFLSGFGAGARSRRNVDIFGSARIPRYNSYFTPNSYQPIEMFNLSSSRSSTTTNHLKSYRSGFESAHAYRPSRTQSTCCTKSNFLRSQSPASRGFPSYTAGAAINSSYRHGSLSETYGNMLDSFRSKTFGTRCAWLESEGEDTEAETEREEENDEEEEMEESEASEQEKNSQRPGSHNKSREATLRSKSVILQRKKAQPKNGSGIKKSASMINPDHNNNFLHFKQSLYFCTRKPGKTEEVVGPERMAILAQPKHYPCSSCKFHRCCGDQKRNKKFTPEMKQRIEQLSQPKFCHYSVCSGCLSPNCLGECATMISGNRKRAKDASQVDWDRLATPRKIAEVQYRKPGEVTKAALQYQINKRLLKMSIPRKVIHSGEYYVWLWNKKPDVHTYLRPVRRLCVSKCDMKDTRVLLRCDLDFTKGKPIDCKVRDTLPTMLMALKKGAKSIVIISRCGPEGVPKDSKFSLQPLAHVFEKYLGTTVVFLDDCIGFQAQALCEDPVPGSVFLLENLNFHPEELGYMTIDEEKKKSTREEVAKFKAAIAAHGDIYITDSFTELIKMTNTTIGYPQKVFGYGFNIKKELSIFNKFCVKPPVPVLAIVAGPFEKTWPVLRNLMGQVRDILVGGHAATAFLCVIKGVHHGDNTFSEAVTKKVLKLFSRARDTNTLLHLPSDVIIKDRNTGDYYVGVTSEDIEEKFDIVDIGPHTRECYSQTIMEAAALLWLGNFGAVSDGTKAIREAYVNAAADGTPTYAADDTIKELISDINKPDHCFFVTGDGEVTESLLKGRMPKGLAVLSKSRKKTRKDPGLESSSPKPTKYEIPGTVIPGGAKLGSSYGTADSLLCINHIPIEDLKVLIRVEFNEPTKDNVVTNNYRMRMTIPTIKYALKWRARAVILMAHFRNPQGRRDSEMSLKPVCDELATLLGDTVIFVPKTVGKDVMTTINQVHPGTVLMLENVRFHSEEEEPTPRLPDGRAKPLETLLTSAKKFNMWGGYSAETNAQFCEDLSRLGDVFINDAFACLHRDHASMNGHLKPTRVCGFLIKNELKYLSRLLNYPERKLLVILGGTNMHDKLDILPGILKEADSLILAGIMACLFLKVQHNLKMGRMTFGESLENRAQEMIKLAEYYKCRIHYPVDLAVSPKQDGKNLKQVSISEGIPKGFVFVDIGKLSASMFTRIIKRNRMVFWSGVAGNGMMPYEQTSTKLMMEALSEATHRPEHPAITIVGGRGLSQLIEKHDPNHECFTHLTTGGRTALQLFGDRSIVGLECLMPKPGKRPLSIMSVADTDIKDQTVLLRGDLDIPLVNGEPQNTYPLHHLCETIKFLQKRGARYILLLGSRGYPDGQSSEALSLEYLGPILEGILDQPVMFINEWVQPGSGDSTLNNAPKGGVILLENVLFHPAETGYVVWETGTRVPVSHDDMDTFRLRLQSLANVVVNESFGSLHFAFTTVCGITNRNILAGTSLKKQIMDYVDMRQLLDSSFLVIMGTEALEDLVERLLLLLDVLDFVSQVFLTGLMASAIKPTSSMSNLKEFKEAALIVPRILRKAKLCKATIQHQTDTLACKDLTNPDEEPKVVAIDSNPSRGFTKCDMGPASVGALSTAIRDAKAVVMCGPTGSVNYEHHQKGTKGILDVIAQVNAEGVPTVALGMQTGQFIYELGHTETFSSYSVDPVPFFHIMRRKPLPGLQVLHRLPPTPIRKLSLEQMILKDQRVLLRVDLDVPTVEDVVLDTDKLEDAAPTIMHCINAGAKCVILMGHRGEPGGYKNFYLRMEPLAVEISAILGMEVTFIDRPCSKKAKTLLEDPPHGSVFLLENLKFYPAESGIEPETLMSRRQTGLPDTSLTSIIDIPKDEAKGKETLTSSGEEETEGLASKEEEDSDEKESFSAEDFSVSDGDGGRSVDSLMYQMMKPKSVAKFKRDLSALGDVFVNDDVAHIEEDLTSFSGLDIQAKGCGLLLADFLRSSDEQTVYELPGVEPLSPWIQTSKSLIG